MAFTSVRGEESCFEKRRPPAAVKVWSKNDNKLPLRSPIKVVSVPNYDVLKHQSPKHRPQQPVLVA